MKILLFIILLLSCTVYVNAALTEKIIYTSIDNCLNVSIDLHGKIFNKTNPVSFKGCSLISGLWWNGIYYCDCKGTGYNNITFISDESYGEDVFSTKFTINSYDIYKFTGDDLIVDHGGYADIIGDITDSTDVNYCIPNNKVMYKDKIIERNYTIEVNNTIQNYTMEYVQNISYIYVNTTIEHNNTEYIQNVTYINKEIITYKINWFWTIVIIILNIIWIILIFYTLIKK